jgi:hypothetical protein
MKRIFIVGCQRSGTTLLQSLMASHSMITSFTETHFFYKGFYPLPIGNYLLKQGTGFLVSKFTEENHVQNSPTNTWPVTRSGREVVLKTAQKLIAILDAAAVERNRDVWIEKTPNHLFFIPLIKKVIPDALFIHVIRRPETALPSQYTASRQWGRPKSYLECALHWALAIYTSDRYLREPGHYCIPYERLASDSELVLKGLFTWLDMPWEDAILEDYKSTAKQVITPEESWKQNTYTEIEHKRTNRFADLPWHARLLINISRADSRFSQIMQRYV